MIDNTAAVSVFNDTIESFKGDITHIKNKIKALKARKTKTVKLVGVIQRIVNKAGYVYLTAYRNQTQVIVNLHSLDGFKQVELTDLLQYLLTYTEANGGTVRNTEWAESLNRDYVFDTKDYYISVHAYVKDDSETCRKVIIGSEMVEQYKYQIVCD